MKESEKNQNILLGSIAVVFMMFICLLPSYAEESLWDKLTAFEDLRKEILVLDQEKRYEEAAKIAEKVVNIGAEIYGPEHPNVELALKNFAAVLNNLAEEYVSKGRYDESVSFHLRALVIRGDILGMYYPDLEQSLYNIGNVYRAQGRYTEAISLFKRALGIREKALGKDHPSLTIILEILAEVYRKIDKTEEAILIEDHAKQIRLKIKK